LNLNLDPIGIREGDVETTTTASSTTTKATPQDESDDYQFVEEDYESGEKEDSDEKVRY